MTKVGYYDPDTAKMILEVVKYLKTSGFVISRPSRGGQQFPVDAPIYVRNDSGEEIPPFACVQTSGTVESGGQNYITVVKPVDETGNSGWYLFNGIAPIEIGGYGIAHDGPECRMLTDGSAVTCGEYWKPNAGAWEIEPGGSLFTAIGPDDIAADVMRGFVYRSNGGSKIQYTITALTTATTGFYTGLKVATVTIETAPCELGDLIGDSVEVVDHSGCVFDLTEAQLIGVWGWASEQVAQSLASGAEIGDLTPCHWAADDRCCTEND